MVGPDRRNYPDHEEWLKTVTGYNIGTVRDLIDNGGLRFLRDGGVEIQLQYGADINVDYAHRPGGATEKTFCRMNLNDFIEAIGGQENLLELRDYAARDAVGEGPETYGLNSAKLAGPILPSSPNLPDH